MSTRLFKKKKKSMLVLIIGQTNIHAIRKKI